ncbi:hypothetical protein JCM9279_005086 [Rhodotorula babjevae]
MTSPTAQPCLICGTPTKNRCSSCAKAGIDLFFCSRDHQKLVWKVHRIDCGPGKAHPVVVPPLEEAEVPKVMAACTRRLPVKEISISALHIPGSVGVKSGPDGMASVISSLYEYDNPSTRRKFEAAKIAPFVGPLGALAISRAWPDASDWIVFLRRLVCQLFDGRPGAQAHQCLPVSYIANYFENSLSGGYSSPVDRRLPDLVKSEFRHRTLILAALLTNESSPPELWPAAVQTLVDFAWRTFAKPSLEETVARFSTLILVMAPIASLFELVILQDPAGGIHGFQCRYHVPS